jgi:cephalosporin-C deacetylase
VPLFEMPLSELQVYAGRNPRPDGFDRYWEAALAEMRATDADLELRPHPSAARFADCFDLFFTGIGGARVYAKYVRPHRARSSPGLLMFHGYTVSSPDWTELLTYAANGFCVAALDCRGQGGRSQDMGGVAGTTHFGHIVRGLEDRPERLLYRQIFLDCAQLAEIVMGFDEVDPDRLAATGESQGGGLTLACAALVPGVRRAAARYPFLCDYQRAWEMDLPGSAYEELGAFFRRFDPRHEREREIFTRLGHIDVQHLAPRIRAEVLMIVGLRDMICPPSTQFAAYNKIRSPKRMVLYPDHAHEIRLPGSFDMMFEFLAELC